VSVDLESLIHIFSSLSEKKFKPVLDRRERIQRFFSFIKELIPYRFLLKYIHLQNL
jgi:hypothetical protein